MDKGASMRDLIISVVIPNRNGEKTLKKCLESIYSQKDVAIGEIILVDDASTDKSLSIVRTFFPKVRILRHDRSYGAAKARNDGIKISVNDLLLFVDNDVYLTESCVKELLKQVDKAEIVYPLVIFEDGTVLSPSSIYEQRYIRRSPVFMVKKNALKKLDELFDETYEVYYEDVDFFTRCLMARLKSRYVSSALAFHATVIKPLKSLEHRYYLELRNLIYLSLKFMRIPKSLKNFMLLPSLKNALYYLRIALTNRNIYLKYPEFPRVNRLSSSSIKVIMLCIKALLWNLFHIRVSLKKCRKLTKWWWALCQMPREE